MDTRWVEINANVLQDGRINNDELLLYAGKCTQPSYDAVPEVNVSIPRTKLDQLMQNQVDVYIYIYLYYMDCVLNDRRYLGIINVTSAVPAGTIGFDSGIASKERAT